MDENMENQKIIIMRHFEPKIEKNKSVSEWSLSLNGIRNMQEALKILDFKKINKVYSSPEKKALITSKEIVKIYNIPLITNKKISEVDRSKVGYIEGNYKKIVSSYLRNKKSFCYSWEKFEDVNKRIKEFINEIKHEKSNLILVSHGMFLSILLHKYFNREIVEFWSSLKFGEVIEVDFEKLINLWDKN
jgi:broad specificity phosphatase PhoE